MIIFLLRGHYHLYKPYSHTCYRTSHPRPTSSSTTPPSTLFPSLLDDTHFEQLDPKGCRQRAVNIILPKPLPFIHMLFSYCYADLISFCWCKLFSLAIFAHCISPPFLPTAYPYQLYRPPTFTIYIHCILYHLHTLHLPSISSNCIPLPAVQTTYLYNLCTLHTLPFTHTAFT